MHDLCIEILNTETKTPIDRKFGSEGRLVSIVEPVRRTVNATYPQITKWATQHSTGVNSRTIVLGKVWVDKTDAQIASAVEVFFLAHCLFQAFLIPLSLTQLPGYVKLPAAHKA